MELGQKTRQPKRRAALQDIPDAIYIDIPGQFRVSFTSCGQNACQMKDRLNVMGLDDLFDRLHVRDI